MNSMTHFKGDDALSHVLSKKAEGLISLTEAHGVEMPGHISAAADSAREVSLTLLMFWFFLLHLGLSMGTQLAILSAFSIGAIIWKTGRSAWLGWARLERLHRVIEEEKYEIEHHRAQEREELKALYKNKGFEGKLLEDVLDVLMADQNRLLKVMLEEELGLTLYSHEHPLKQAIGGFIGSFISSLFSLGLFFFMPLYGMAIAAFCIISVAAITSALFEKNRWIPALIWNLSLAALSFGIVYFMFKILHYES
jgi:vacuolar iron transporter family protein